MITMPNCIGGIDRKQILNQQNDDSEMKSLTHFLEGSRWFSIS